MRRYGVRILVAVLTFGLGVAFSFVLGGFGLFSARQTTKPHNWGRRDCPKKFRSQVLVPLAIVNQANAPLRLVDLGPTFNTDSPHEHFIRVSAQNESNRTITGFVLRGEKVFHSKGVTAGELTDFNSDVLEPGQSRVIHLLNDNETGVSLAVSQVKFLDGSTWNNPRELQ